MGIDGDAPDPPHRRFGGQGGLLSYGDHLRLPELLDQRRPRSAAPDEQPFITAHQISEPCVKPLLREPEPARTAMSAGEPWRAGHLFRRVRAAERVMTEQVEVLETMTPQDFPAFRAGPAPASGFQPVPFGKPESPAGPKDERHLGSFGHAGEDELARLRRSLAEPTLWDAYQTALSQRGLPVSDSEIMDSLPAVARDRGSHDDPWQLAEDLLTHDETAALWRMRHVQRVERQIGTRSGTGGSTGAPHPRGRTRLHYFPLLWELRAWL